MDSFNNNFKSFDDEQTDLPQGFGWDDMKEGVYDKMPPKKKRRVAAWWWFGMAGMVAVSLSVWMLLSDGANTPESTFIVSNSTSTTTRPNQNNITTSFESEAESDDEQGTQRANISDAQLSQNPASNNEITASKSFSVATPRINVMLVKEEASEILNLMSEVPKREFASSATHSAANTQIKEKLTLSAIPSLEIIPIEIDNRIPIIPIKNTISIQKHQNITKANFLLIEGISTVTTGTNDVVNSPYISTWYGFGASIGYQRQLSRRLSLSAHYAFQQTKQEFSFSDRDTIAGTNTVERTVDFLNSTTLSHLTSHTTNENEQINRVRNVLSYNTFDVHQFSSLLHLIQPIGSKSNFDLALGGGLQYLGSAKGLRLDNQGEVINLQNEFRANRRVLGILEARFRYLHQLSPKLQLSGGVNYNHLLQGEIPSTVSGRIGLRVKL